MGVRVTAPGPRALSARYSRNEGVLVAPRGVTAPTLPALPFTLRQTGVCGPEVLESCAQRLRTRRSRAARAAVATLSPGRSLARYGLRATLSRLSCAGVVCDVMHADWRVRARLAGVARGVMCAPGGVFGGFASCVARSGAGVLCLGAR